MYQALQEKLQYIQEYNRQALYKALASGRNTVSAPYMRLPCHSHILCLLIPQPRWHISSPTWLLRALVHGALDLPTPLVKKARPPLLL